MNATLTTETIKVPGATLYYEVRGSGPVLLCITGGPTDAGIFTDLATRLSDRYTVVTYDQRGHSRSSLDADAMDIPVHVHADDAADLLDALTEQPALVYGSSGGGTIGLELLTRHPDQVRQLVAHEAPVMELLPDAGRWRQNFTDIYEIYRTEGVFAAMERFGGIVEDGGPSYSEAADAPAPDPAVLGRMMGNFDLFIAHEIRQVGGYVPDVNLLRELRAKVVCAAGATSEQQGACRAAHALAARLDIPTTILPGAHGGWGSDPQHFADALDAVLQEAI